MLWATIDTAIASATSSKTVCASGMPDWAASRP